MSKGIKIFLTLVGVVVGVLLGAFILNLVLPNATAQVTNQIERQIFRATSISFNFNGDGYSGSASEPNTNPGDTGDDVGTGNVDGFN